jgi:hypothetical protein
MNTEYFIAKLIYIKPDYDFDGQRRDWLNFNYETAVMKSAP